MPQIGSARDLTLVGIRIHSIFSVFVKKKDGKNGVDYVKTSDCFDTNIGRNIGNKVIAAASFINKFNPF